MPDQKITEDDINNHKSSEKFHPLRTVIQLIIDEKITLDNANELTNDQLNILNDAEISVLIDNEKLSIDEAINLTETQVEQLQSHGTLFMHGPGTRLDEFLATLDEQLALESEGPPTPMPMPM